MRCKKEHRISFIRLFVVILLFAGVFTRYGSKVSADANQIKVTYRSKKEIMDFFDANPVNNLSASYKVQPSIQTPYAAGELEDVVLQDALAMLNRVRFVAGLSSNVTLKDSYNQMAQAASMVCAANGTLSHSPDRPAGMSDDLYQLAKNGAGSSNIAAGYSTLASGILDGWVEDSDSSNISILGHRRWVLNPSMKSVGFGDAIGRYGSWYPMHYQAMYAFDNSFVRTGEVSVWPAQNTPVEYFGRESAWSYSTGKTENAANVKVTLTNVTKNKTWVFSSASADGYFNVDNAGYGLPGCIIFRPQDYAAYQQGEVYTVRIEGLTGGTVQYTVNFFSMKTPYAVSFDANGGNGNMASSGWLKNGAVYSMPECAFLAPAGKEFDHWSINNAVCQPGDSVTVTDDLVVKAVWKEAAPTDENLRIAKRSLALFDTVTINFKIEKAALEGKYHDPYLTVTQAGNVTPLAEYEDDGTYLIFNYRVVPYMMRETVKAVPHALNAGNEDVTGAATEYSVAEYCKNMLGKENYQGDAYKTFRRLCVDILRYGDAAQRFMNYKTGELASAVLTDGQLAMGTDVTVPMNYANVREDNYENVSDADRLATIATAALLLEAAVNVQFKYEAENLSGLRVVVKDEGGVLGEYEADPVLKDTNGRYYAVFGNLNAGQMRKTVYATVMKGGKKVSNTFRYSIESYVQSMKGKGGDILDNLLDAMMRYGDAAADYVAGR